MTVGGASGSPAVFQGEATRQGAGALTPYPRFPAAIPPRVEGTGRERYLQNPWRGVIPVAGKMHLGVSHGATRGEGRALTPSPTLPAATMPPFIEGTDRERYLQNPWRGGIPVAGRMHLGVTHGGRKGRGRGIGPFPDVSRRRHTSLHRGNRQGRYLQNPWRGGIPVAGRMHLGVTHGGCKGRGGGIGPLIWASRHRRGGLPIRSSERDRPHMGQGGI